MNALPIEDELKHLHRQYLANVIYTLVGQPFMDWVDNGITTRNTKVNVEANNMVKMDPRVYEVYKTSTTVSSKYHQSFKSQQLLILIFFNHSRQG